MLSIAVLGCLVLVAGVGALSYHSSMKISEVRVEGATVLDARTLSESARGVLKSEGFALFSRANMFLYPQTEMAAKLARDFPRIRDVAVSRESLLSQAVIVSIAERVPTNTWCGTTCYLMDENGLIFDNAQATVGYTFFGGLLPGEPIGQYVLRGRLDSVTGILAELARIGFAPVSLRIENDSDYTVRVGRGYDLKLGFDTDERELIKNLQLLRTNAALAESNDIEYVDLRFGNRIYVKPKNAEPAPIE